VQCWLVTVQSAGSGVVASATTDAYLSCVADGRLNAGASAGPLIYRLNETGASLATACRCVRRRTEVRNTEF
jgi:hypothetical protein